VYVNNNTFTLSAHNISGNSAENGGGVFVRNTSNAKFIMSGGVITYNAAKSGGGIAAGGNDVQLKFQGTVTVRHNTTEIGKEDGKPDPECNVYLDKHTNTIIRTTGTKLEAASYIGVYVTEEQWTDHGAYDRPFGTIDTKADNLARFINDKAYSYGVNGGDGGRIGLPGRADQHGAASFFSLSP